MYFFPILSFSLSYQSKKNYAKLADIILFLHLPWETAAVPCAMAIQGHQSDSWWLLLWRYGSSCWTTAICDNQVLTEGNDKIHPKPSNNSKEGFSLISVLLVLFQALIGADFLQENTRKANIQFYLSPSLHLYASNKENGKCLHGGQATEVMFKFWSRIVCCLFLGK